MGMIPEAHRKIYEKYGTTRPIHITDGDGKVLYSDKNVMDLAKFSVNTGQFMRDAKASPLGADAICQGCKEPSSRFFSQIFETGWTCNCGIENPKKDFPEAAKSLSSHKSSIYEPSEVEVYITKYLKEIA